MAASSTATVNAGARIWTPYRDLLNLVDSVLYRKRPDALEDLNIALRKHKPDFLSLLKNPIRSSHLRELVKHAHTTGLPIFGEKKLQVLSQQFIDEALIVSDLFELHEFAAVELLMAGEKQQVDFPGLSRGLVAVLLYYDGHRSLVNSLRDLIKSREGRMWTLELSNEVVALTTSFTDELLQNGLTDRIFDLLSSMNLDKELEKLQKDRALGSLKHRQQVSDLYNEIQLSLAECLFCLSCQQPLSKADTLRLIEYLKSATLTTGDNAQDNVTICLLMTLLYSFDVTVLEYDLTEDGNKQVNLPILSDPTYFDAVHKEMKNIQNWSTPGLKSAAQFAWAISLCQICHQAISERVELCEEDETLVDEAIKQDLFEFLNKYIISSPSFHSEEFYVRRIHGLITDFIYLMPLKWKELRNNDEEVARIQSHLHGSTLAAFPKRRDFEHLLLLMNSLYLKDPLQLELTVDYWISLDTYNTGDSGRISSSANYQTPKQASLYKFIRLSGDMLHSSLFVPYIKMLTGLSTGGASSQHCFSLLHNNTSTSGGSGNLISWDHIFYSLNKYYANLRREVPTSHDFFSSYSSGHPKTITPEELEGLLAVMKLIAHISSQNEYIRISIAENQEWLATVVLFGLLGCSVPPKLKAEILLALSALAKTPQIAAKFWQSLEMSRILPISGSASGIQVEVDEIETKMEQYPLTRAFLDFLHTLTKVPVPPGLGAGQRTPGFGPYFSFIRDIFLKFQSRAYRDGSEKWEVASSCLAVFRGLLSQYDPSSYDLPNHQLNTPQADLSPGNMLMVNMLNECGILKVILSIIERGITILGNTASPEYRSMEKASLIALDVVEMTLKHEPVFVNHLRQTSDSRVIVASLDQLLMQVNPVTAVADYVVSVAKYITLSNHLPRHSLSAVKIIHSVSQSSAIHSQLLPLFTANEITRRMILCGFVQSLETDESESTDDPDFFLKPLENSDSEIRCQLREQILSLLISSLKLPAPNLAHLLLGFDIQKPIRKTTLQPLGVPGVSKSCLHVILSLLDASAKLPASLLDKPNFCLRSYRLIYLLCLDKDTASPLLRYLRTTWDFLYSYIDYLPFTSIDNSLLQHQSWLLRAVAIELRVTSVNRQRSHTSRFIHAFLSDVAEDQPTVGERYDLPTAFSVLDKSSISHNVTSLVQGRGRKRKIISILDSLDFYQIYPEDLKVEFFDALLVEEVIQSCQRKNSDEVIYYDVQLLHQILLAEVNRLHKTTVAAQRPLIMEEIKSILRTVASRNRVSEELHRKREALQAWQEMVEVLFTACPTDTISTEIRMNSIFELLQDLLIKVSDGQALTELTAPLSRVILLLTSSLLQTFRDGDNEEHLSSDNTTQMNSVCAARTLYGTSLTIVFKGLLEHLLRVSGGQHAVRTNLYGAILFYMQIADPPKSFLTSALDNQSVMSRVISSKLSECEKLKQENFSLISTFGENLLDVICRDSCDGHDICRMLALSVLGVLMKFDHLQQWLGFLDSKGYLVHLVNSLLDDDVHLQASIANSSSSLKVVFIYQSKMSLLCQIASTSYGAQLLLRSRIMDRLSQCIFIDMRPDDSNRKNKMAVEDDALPTSMTHYRQLLGSTLNLCLAILTSTSLTNLDARGQMMRFVLSHIEVFQLILHSSHSVYDVSALRELVLVTALLSHSLYYDEDIESISSEAAVVEYRGHATRIQRLLIGLLGKFTSPMFSSRIISAANPTDQKIRAQISTATQEIVANTMAFCRRLLASNARNSRHSKVVFGPDLMEAFMNDVKTLEAYQETNVPSLSCPNLGVVVILLKSSCQQFTEASTSHQRMTKQLESVSDLDAEDLIELSGLDSSDKTSTPYRLQLARQALLSRISSRATEMQRLFYTIENMLFIIWKHLDYYFKYGSSSIKQTPVHSSPWQQPTGMRRLQEYPIQGTAADVPYNQFMGDTEMDARGLEVNLEKINRLKLQASTVINDSLFKKLNEISLAYGKSRKNGKVFIEAVVRCIKRLLNLNASNAVTTFVK